MIIVNVLVSLQEYMILICIYTKSIINIWNSKIKVKVH